MEFTVELVSIEYHASFDNISRINDIDPLNGAF